jgi:isopentenyl-diphosphate delta-isomerase
MRRLKEELGCTTQLEPAFSFIYKAALDNELTEYEFDHVLIGIYEGGLLLNEDEVADYCFRSMGDLKEHLAQYPAKYTAWFKIALPMLEEYLIRNKMNIHEA